MKRTAKILSLTLCFLLLLGTVFSLPVSADEEPAFALREKESPVPLGATSLISQVGADTPVELYKDGFTYVVIEEQAVITAYEDHYVVDLVVPSHFDSYPVVEIADRALRDMYRMQTLTLPDTLIYIGDEAFDNCGALLSVEIPEGVVYIGDSAFAGDDSLSEVKLPKTLVYIGGHAFAYCKALAEFEVPEGVRFFGSKVLRDTAWYKNQPEGVLYVGHIAYGVKEGEHYAKEITLKEGTKTIANSAFQSVFTIVQVDMPEGLEVIGDCAFEDTSLHAVDIPASVYHIGTGAFRNCVRLMDVKIHEDNEIYMSEDSVIYDKEKLALLYCPIQKTTEVYTVDEGVQYIGPYAFWGSWIKGIELPDSLLYIDEYAFEECKKLTSVDIPNSVLAIGMRAFVNCKALSEVSLPVYLTYVDTCTFAGCDALTQVKIPYYCGYLEQGAFGSCRKLETVYLPDSLYYVGETALNNDSIKNFYYGLTFDELVEVFIHESNESFLTATINYNTSVFDVCLGDANEDAFVNVKDATLIQKNIAKMEAINPLGEYSSDVNDDGAVDVRDATAIQKHTAKVATGFKIGEKQEKRISA